MADAAVGATVQVLLETIISLAADRIGLSFGFKDELENLKESAAAIQAVLADAESKQRQEEQVKLWLKRLEGVAFEADNAFDELNYQLLRRQVKSRNRQQQQLKGKARSNSEQENSDSAGTLRKAPNRAEGRGPA